MGHQSSISLAQILAGLSIHFLLTLRAEIASGELMM
jgi:hypothetical protein